MRLSWKREALSLVLLVAMYAVALASWVHVGDRIPVHWNIAGQPDRLGGRFEGLLGIPLLTTGIYLLMTFLPRVDPRREHYRSFAGIYSLFRTLIVAVLAGLYLVVVLWARGLHVDVGLVCSLAIGLMYVVMGNYLPKVRSNWWIGVRTPWTLSSERSWAKTHRLAGKLFMAIGGLMIATALIRTDWAFRVMVAGLAIMLVVLLAYSYAVWRQDPDRAGT